MVPSIIALYCFFKATQLFSIALILEKLVWTPVALTIVNFPVYHWQEAIIERLCVWINRRIGLLESRIRALVA